MGEVRYCVCGWCYDVHADKSINLHPSPWVQQVLVQLADTLFITWIFVLTISSPKQLPCVLVEVRNHLG